MKAFFSILIAVILTMSANDASAIRPRSAELRGKVQNLDETAHHLTVAGRTFKMVPETKFIAKTHFVSRSQLEPGASVLIRYRTPFFGPPFLTRVIWLPEPTNDSQ